MNRSIPLGVQWVPSGRTDVISLGEQGFPLEEQEYPSGRTEGSLKENRGFSLREPWCSDVL